MDLLTRLKLDSSQHNSEIEKAKQKVSDYKQEADKASDSLKDMSDNQTRSAKDLLKAMSEIEGTTRSTSNYRAQLAKITKEIQDLTVNYRAMNSEMQNSDFGREVAAKIQELTKEASGYKDAILDANAAVRSLASDTAAWDSMKQGIEVASSAIQGLVSAGVMGARSTEKLVAVLAKLKAIETATNAVIKIGNALQKQSSLMQGILRVQAAALAKARAQEASATVAATVAQRAFNAVAKANPYVLLASVIISLVGALTLFTKKTKEVEKATEDQSDALESAAKEADSYRKSFASTTADLVSKYKILQIQYSKLKDEHEKVQWIKNTKSEFEDLGLKVNDVNDAESTFVTNASSIVESLKTRAKAVAMQQQMVDLYKQLFEAELQAEEDYNARKKVMTNDAIKTNEQLARGESVDPGRARWAQNMVKDVEQYNTKLKSEVYSTVDEINKKIEQCGEEIAGSIDMSQLTKKTTANGGGKIEIEPEIGSLDEANKRVRELEAALNRMSPNNEAFEETKNSLEAAKKTVEEIQSKMTAVKPVQMFEEGSLEDANYFVNLFTNKLKDMSVDSEEFDEVVRLLNIWKTRQQEINDKINGTKKKAKSVVEQYQEIVSQANDINLQFSIGAIDEASARKQIDDLNKKLKNELKLTAQVELKVDTEAAKTNLQSFLDSIEVFNEGVSSVTRFTSSISGAYDSISSLGDRLQEETDGVKQFFMIWDSGVQLLNAVTTTMQTLAPVIDAITAATTASAAAKKKEAAASAENTIAQEVETRGESKSAIAKMLSAIAGAAKAVASIPFVGPALAVAAAAAVTAALVAAFSKGKAQKFSQGGIFKSNSSVGDKNYARLSDGEMVINTWQQKRLFKLLDSTGIINGQSEEASSNGGTVEFKINGDTLVGVLDNHYRKYNHAR